MKVILYDLDSEYGALIESKCDRALAADGKYAPCQGCFRCWTKHPAECFMKDKLRQVCRLIGRADELVIVTKNLYGGYSAAVKNVLDRSIGTSTPLSTYRGRHHRDLYALEHLQGQADAPYAPLRKTRSLESHRLRRGERAGNGHIPQYGRAERGQRRL